MVTAGKFWISILNESECMRLIFFLLGFPFFISAQTVNVEKSKIVYKGKVHVEGASAEQLTSRARRTILDLDKDYESKVNQNEDGTTRVWFQGATKLASSDHVSKKVTYIVEINVKDGSYEYRIDSVYLVQKEPGQHAKETSSEELLNKMESSGPVAASTEALLNEIDMDFQKLIDRFTNDMTKDVTNSTSTAN